MTGGRPQSSSPYHVATIPGTTARRPLHLGGHHDAAPRGHDAGHGADHGADHTEGADA